LRYFVGVDSVFGVLVALRRFARMGKHWRGVRVTPDNVFDAISRVRDVTRVWAGDQMTDMVGVGCELAPDSPWSVLYDMVFILY